MKRNLFFIPAALAFLFSNLAFAGNQNSFFMGNDAALTGGAIPAITRDSEGIWYNPAALGGSTLTRVNLSGNAFQLRLQNVNGGVETQLPSGTVRQNLTGNEYLAVPTAMTFMTGINDKVSIGFGVYMPIYQDVTYNNNLTSLETFPAIGVPTNYKQGLDVDTLHNQYQIGVAAGYAATEKFRLGGAIFGLYDRLRYNTNAFESIESADGSGDIEIFSVENQRALVSNLGLRGTLGAQYDITPEWTLAAVAFSPTLQIVSWGEASAETGSVSLNSKGELVSSADRFFTKLKQWEGDMIQPFHAQLSLGYKQPDYWIGVAGDIYLPLTNNKLQIRQRTNWNVCAGSKFKISEKFNLGVGLFTDNSSQKKPADFGETQVNYYGLSFGAEFKTPVSRGSDGGQPIVFTTVLAGRYALGIGKFGGLLFDPETDGPITNARIQIKDVVFNELSLYIGTGLYF